MIEQIAALVEQAIDFIFGPAHGPEQEREAIPMVHPLEGAVTHRIHGGWGDHIEWHDWENRKVWGHVPVRPKVGDYLMAEMKSDKTAIFQFTDVEYMTDPNDMFFGDVRDLGYVDEIDFELPDGPKVMFFRV